MFRHKLGHLKSPKIKKNFEEGNIELNDLCYPCVQILPDR